MMSALGRTKDFQRVIVPVRSGWRYDGQSHLTMMKRSVHLPLKCVDFSDFLNFT